MARLVRAGRRLPDDKILAHIAPVAFGHINVRGIYRFPLERYVDRLFPSAQGLQKAINESQLSTGNRDSWSKVVTTPV
jgi:hypothetical protein